ncbi:pseudouridine synthase [Marinobacter persicus]|jgi:23S rRNA pseudouridine2457 synthase|uniref:Pseudouridine synthase n=1 Tax=Marinobacter persicus TaxID=930118 RepID=A0A2S6G8R6_9GAMM|nr:pseudouridine synthase [Marinobacter persicus]PPK52817.1 23S rRNA pseudouridine2457 synthase [Marinobacter persicus]PPK55637.1 23S rRNA pseudouridine2457 synthase [Marinobacter persicus]PPK59328.1 23S rRNA pseudouridine2457 synthase [Marinobacter persicus]
MAELIIFNKPFQVLSQFTDERADRRRATLAEWIDQPGFYPAGRLDYDSEGLLLLTNEGALQHRIASPRNKMPKTYWVQVEGEIPDSAIEQLSQGVALKDGVTSPAKAQRIPEPDVWPRTPPVRHRESVPTSWLELTITEGRNRQVRRMTAAVGYPTLRLIRCRIGDWTIAGLQPGDYRRETVHLPRPATGRGKPGTGGKTGRRNQSRKRRTKKA